MVAQARPPGTSIADTRRREKGSKRKLCHVPNSGSQLNRPRSPCMSLESGHRAVAVADDPPAAAAEANFLKRRPVAPPRTRKAQPSPGPEAAAADRGGQAAGRLLSKSVLAQWPATVEGAEEA